MTKFLPSLCYACRHLARDEHHNSFVPPHCSAFPTRIPSVIFQNLYDHRFPYPGDQEIRFEAADQESAEIIEILAGPFDPIYAPTSIWPAFSLTDFRLRNGPIVADWLEAARQGQVQASDGASLADITQVLAERAVTSSQPDLAHEAVKMYEWLRNQTALEQEREWYQTLDMSIRAKMVSKFREYLDDPYFRLAPLITWFSDAITMSLDEIASQLSHWNTLSDEERLPLIRLRQRVEVMRPLLPTGYLDAYPDIVAMTQIDFSPMDANLSE